MLNRIKSLFTQLYMKILRFMSQHNILVEYYTHTDSASFPMSSPQQYCAVSGDCKIQGSLSYVMHRFKVHNEAWYWTKKTQKKLLVLEDSIEEWYELAMRFTPTRMLVQFSFDNWMWVSAQSPNVSVCSYKDVFAESDAHSYLKIPYRAYDVHTVDFSQLNLMYKMKFTAGGKWGCEEAKKIVEKSLDYAKRNIERSLSDRYPEHHHQATGIAINYENVKLRYGAKFVPNRICHFCEAPFVSMQGKCTCVVCGRGEPAQEVSDTEWRNSIYKNHEVILRRLL